MEGIKRCEICDKIFLNESDLLIHFRSNYHLQRKKCQKSVYINRVPCDICIDDIIKCLLQFGQIIKYDVISNNSYNNVTIEFRDKETVQVVLSETIRINNKQLYIYPLQYYEKKADETNSLRYDKIKAVLNSKSNFNNQLQVFLNAIAITEQEVKLRYQPVCQTLDKLFQTTFTKCKSYMFGSMVTGLGFKNSDLDIYLNIGKPVVEGDTFIRGPHVITMDSIFSITTRVLQKNRKLFSSCCSIRTAKMPIIKCIYLPTNVHCDISFKNNIALYNSKLVHYYLSLDCRFTPLMMLIKYWLYNYESTNVVGITKYAMAMLFIFYLQQVKLVPAVIQLQKECTVPIFIKGWQVNFNKGSTKLNAKNDYANKSIPEILGEFFKFYANYDFKTQVLCPIDGQSHSKESFERKCLPSDMMGYINYLKRNENPEELTFWKPLCLQDPIEMNNNLTKNLNIAYLDKLQDYFSAAAKIIEFSSKNNYRDLLRSLFDTSAVMYSKIKRESFCLEIYPSELIGTGKNMDPMIKIFNIKNWFDITLNIVKQILSKVLNFEVKTNKTTLDSLKREIKNESTAISKDEKVIVLYCKGNQRLWFNRKNIKTCNISNALEKEIIITKRLLNIEMKKNVSDVIINLECHFSRRATSKDHMCIMVYNDGCSGKIFNEFSNYFQAKTPSILKKVFSNIQNNPSILESLLK